MNRLYRWWGNRPTNDWEMIIMADFKHKAEELGGKAKEAAGNLTNNDELRDEGRGEQSKAEMKQAADDVRDKAEEGLGKLRGDNR